MYCVILNLYWTVRSPIFWPKVRNCWLTTYAFSNHNITLSIRLHTLILWLVSSNNASQVFRSLYWPNWPVVNDYYFRPIFNLISSKFILLKSDLRFLSFYIDAFFERNPIWGFIYEKLLVLKLLSVSFYLKFRCNIFNTIIISHAQKCFFQLFVSLV